MREELHERLEGMVLDVQDLIDSQENPENSPANAESDELYVWTIITSFIARRLTSRQFPSEVQVVYRTI